MNVDYSLHVQNDDIQIACVPGLRLSSSKHDKSHRYLLASPFYEESVSTFYPQIQELLKPSHVVDIGANYGAISCVAFKSMPQAHFVLVEPTDFLIKFINYNVYINGMRDYEIIHAVVGNEVKNEHGFYINPHGTLDNRASSLSNREKVIVKSTTLKNILDNQTNISSLFMKIDTQGFEPKIFDFDYLSSLNYPWIIRSEYAPKWIKDAGMDPKEFLKKLVTNFDIYQDPARYDFNFSLLDYFKNKKINPSEIESFYEYIINLSRSELGWVDLLILPKNFLK